MGESVADKAVKAKSLGTKRFQSYLSALGVLASFGMAALLTKADPALIVAVSGPVVALAGAALGFGSWHDKGVREAQGDSDGSLPVVPEVPPTGALQSPEKGPTS